MCFFRAKNIYAIFIIPIFWNILDGMVLASLDTVNDLNDIKTLFDRHNNSVHNGQLVKEKLENKNFAEGGLITSYSVTTTQTNNSSTSNNLKEKNLSKISNESHQKESNSSHVFNSSMKKSDNDNNINPSLNSKSTTLTKLIDGGTNLFLGAPEVIHINGTSSIKPRKGVYYNKIVPRKGVDPEYDFNHNSLNKCFSVRENECYVTPQNFQDLNSFCCNKTNADNITKEMSSIYCSNCNVTKILYNNTCEHICFQDVASIKKIHEIETEFESKKNNFNLKHSFKMHTSEKTLISNKPLVGSSASPNEKLFRNTLKKTKSKPELTKVPEDVEFVDLFSRSKKDVLLPILVSLFLLPLIGMLVFFIWQRTKEYWSKRYYKRMDFLIDGMYNDQYS